VHQIRFRPELRPGPRCGAYSAPPDPLAGLRGLLLRGGGKRTGKDGKVGKGRGREGTEQERGMEGRVGMPGKGEGRKGEGGRRGEGGRGGKKSKNTPPSIPAYAPGRMVPSQTTGHTDQP